MKAIKEKNQAALDRFMDNEFWKKFYEDAPSGAKALIEDGFTASLSDDDSEDGEEVSEDSLTVEDIRYFAERGYNQQMRKHYADLLEKRTTSSSPETDAATPLA